MRAYLGDGSPLGGPFGPDQCKTGGLGPRALADGQRRVQLVAEDAAGNLTTITRSVAVDANAPSATLTRASGRTITVRVADGASRVSGGTIEVRNRPGEPFRALPTTLANGRLSARLDRGSVARVGIRVTVTDNAGNVTAGQLNELALRVGGRALRRARRRCATGARRASPVGCSLVTLSRSRVCRYPSRRPRACPEPHRRPSPRSRRVSRGDFAYRAPAGVSRTLRFSFAGAPDLVALTRGAQLRRRASSSITASPRVLAGRGRVRFSGRLGLRGATTPRSGKIVELQAYDGGRWRIFATARARGSKGRWSASHTFAGTPGRYPVRLRIRREAVFPYDLGYSRSVVVRVR